MHKRNDFERLYGRALHGDLEAASQGVRLAMRRENWEAVHFFSGVLTGQLTRQIPNSGHMAISLPTLRMEKLVAVFYESECAPKSDPPVCTTCGGAAHSRSCEWFRTEASVRSQGMSRGWVRKLKVEG